MSIHATDAQIADRDNTRPVFHTGVHRPGTASRVAAREPTAAEMAMDPATRTAAYEAALASKAAIKAKAAADAAARRRMRRS